MNLCLNCGEDLVKHHPRNLRCREKKLIFAEATKDNFYKSFDARIWANLFVEIVDKNKIQIDEEFMTTWFANALMRGYDEKYWQSDEYKELIKRCSAA